MYYFNKGKGVRTGSFYAHFLKRGQNRMEFRPCIDIHNGKVKQIVGSSLRDAGDQASENFVSGQDAPFYARMYQSRGIRGGHIILLNAKDSPYYEETKNQALAALRAYPGGLQVGGGITDANASEFLEAGASAVIVTSFVFRDGRIDYDCLNRLEQAVGKEHLVLDLSCRYRADAEEPGYYIVTDRWQKFTNQCLDEALMEKLHSYCDEFLVHAVNVEGTGTGVDEDLLKILAKESEIPITYAGGIGSYEDIEKIQKTGKNRVNYTIGSALDLFGGSLKFDTIVTKYN